LNVLKLFSAKITYLDLIKTIFQLKSLLTD